MSKIWLSPAEVAVRPLFRCSTVTLCRWRKTGKGPPFEQGPGKKSGRIRYRLTELEAWEEVEEARRAQPPLRETKEAKAQADG